MERRIRRLGIFMVLCFTALFFALNNIQVLKATSLSTNPESPGVQMVNRDQPRGEILSANGVVLASSVPVSSPKAVYKYRRVYNPFTASLFSQIVGFDSPIYGKTGIELEYDSSLRSHTRPAKSLADLLVNRTSVDNVTLTINTKLQSEVAQVMDQVQTQDAAPVEGAVVIDPKTGAILAMASNPTYNPTDLVSQSGNVERYYYESLDPSSDRSPLVSNTFGFGFIPGSTFKAVTSSAVFDHDPALAKVDYPPATCIKVQQRVSPICNYQGSGGIEKCGGTITVTLPESCNTAFLQMGLALGTNLSAEAEAFGFNQHIPIDLPGAAVSTFPTAAEVANDQPLLATSAFGQGAGNNTVIATPLQMALVAAGIANQGVIMTPHVMAQIRDSQGNLVQKYQPTPWLTATSPFTAAAVTSLMQSVVTQPGATAYGLFPAAWNVAAKTGTAETGGGAQGNTLTNDWMIAFAPANDPTVAVAVVVPNQPSSQTGASVSGPPTREILGYALGQTP